MKIEQFINEISSYSEQELELIINTQKDLYSTEEMSLLELELQKRKEQKQQRIIENLPKQIMCPECEGPNPFENDVCCFCGCKLDKNKYYKENWQDEENEKLEETDEMETESSYIFHYVISVLIPLIGFITGAVLITKENEQQRSAGKTCIVLGVISVIIGTFLILQMNG